MQHALNLAPSDVRRRALLGWVQMRQGLLDEAERVFVALLSENSLHAMARVNLGYVCLKKGELDRATELLVPSSRQSGDPKAALYATFYRGLLHSVEGDFAEAEYCFGKTILLAPNFIEGYYELARAEIGRASWRRRGSRGKRDTRRTASTCGESAAQMQSGYSIAERLHQASVELQLSVLH